MSEFGASMRPSSLRANIFSAQSAAVLAIYLYVLLVPDEHMARAGSVRGKVLAVFGCLYIVRLNVMARWLLPRGLGMEELVYFTLVWIPAVLASFAIPAVASQHDIGLSSFVLSLVLYVAGSFLNTWSELERKLLVNGDDGHFFTAGLFRIPRDINYVFDVLLFAGWAVATGAWWNAWVPISMGLSFCFHNAHDQEEGEADSAQKYSQGRPAFVGVAKVLISIPASIFVGAHRSTPWGGKRD